MFSPRILNTMLAALRFYQQHGQCDPINRSVWIDDIATNGGQQQPLTALEIDQLCQRLNQPETKEAP